MGNFNALAYDLLDYKAVRATSSLPSFSNIQHADLVSIPLSNDTTNLTHGLHRFPAKFIPQVPRWAIEQFSSEGDCILDPFAGSGTTLVEAAASNRVSLGIEIDPLNALICKAKTTALDPSQLLFQSSQLMKASKTYLSFRPKMSGVKNFDHWFAPDVSARLESIYREIEQMQCTEEQRLFFLVTFSSILRRVSNADDQSQKTYVSGTSKKKLPEIEVVFKRQLERNIRGMAELSGLRNLGASHIVQGSAASLPFEDQKIDLIVTSPPYLDSVDYMYNFMVEYFWLGPRLGILSRDAFNQRRKLPLGSKKLNHKNALPPILDDLVNLDTILPYRRKAAAAYFGMMAEHFREAARVTKKGGKYVLVIGNSQSNNGYIPVHDCLVRLAGAAGFGLLKAFAYRIRRHYMKFPRKGRGGIILMDWVIVLEREGGHSTPDRLPQPHISISPDAVAH